MYHILKIQNNNKKFQKQKWLVTICMKHNLFSSRYYKESLFLTFIILTQ